MKRIELTISPDYASTWDFVDAVRELFQNALDQQAQEPGKDAYWYYERENEKLVIGNKRTTLTTESLLLGKTTKADDKKTIGHFGEGYKIASLALLRAGKSITIYNNCANEIWTPVLVKSETFGTTLLTFIIQEYTPESFCSNDCLEIEIGNIQADEYDLIVESNLHLQHNVEVYERTDVGDIINKPGQIFVNGLFVCKLKQFKFGYNFTPGCLELDRDRKCVNDFNIKWFTSVAWRHSNRKQTVLDMIENNDLDVAYIDELTCSHKWRDLAYQRFRQEHGSNAVPVCSNRDLDKVSTNFVPVVVSPLYKSLIVSSSDYQPSIASIQEPLEALQTWYDSIKLKLNREEEAEAGRVLKALQHKYR